MMTLIGGGLLCIGACVVLSGAVGLLRLPDFFCRLHGAGVIDTLGAGLVILAMLFLSGSIIIAFKVVMIGVLLFILSPVTSHALARAALQSGLTVRADRTENRQTTGRD